MCPPLSSGHPRYIVAFRSTRAADSPSRDLYEADRQAHEEAVTVRSHSRPSCMARLLTILLSNVRCCQAGGLLAYWYGAPNQHGSNLATCIWMSRAHAVKATSGPKHAEAMRLATVSAKRSPERRQCIRLIFSSLAQSMYANYDLERYVLKKVKGETGVTVERWNGGEVEFE